MFLTPSERCTASPGTVSVSFAAPFPPPAGSTQPPKLFYKYAGSMPAGAALEACRRKGQALLSPLYGNETMGTLQVRRVGLIRKPASVSLF